MHEIIRQLVKACSPTPVTAKIRLGCSPENINCNEIARLVEEAGAAALTVHGRTAKDMFKGNADWDRISEIKSHLINIPLIGNGDLDSAEKVVAAFENYHVDGVMIARACLGRPWIFAQAAAALRGEPVPPDPTLAQQRAVMLKHFDLVREPLWRGQGHGADAEVRLLLCPRQTWCPALPDPCRQDRFSRRVPSGRRSAFSSRGWSPSFVSESFLGFACDDRFGFRIRASHVLRLENQAEQSSPDCHLHRSGDLFLHRSSPWIGRSRRQPCCSGCR